MTTKPRQNPMHRLPDWHVTMPLAHACLRCGARTRRGIPCRLRIDRDRGTPHGAAPPTPPGIRVTYHGGSIGLSGCRNIESGETD
jgi:hypothetical protein